MGAWKEAAQSFMTHGSYYVFLLLFSLLAFRYFQIKDRIISFFKTNLRAVVISAGLTAMVFASVAPELRVSGDENDLLGVANGMSASGPKRADRPMDLQGTKPDYLASNWGMDFRALAFPFASQIMHVFSGDYSEKRVFALNAFLLFCFLAVVYRVFEKRLGAFWAFSALLAVLAQPILSFTAASAGYDMAALLFLALAILFLYEFLEKPDSARFGFLWIHLLVLANIRHEGIVIFAVIVGGLLVSGSIRKEYWRDPAIWLTPLFLAPLALQRLFVPFWGQQPGKTVLDFFSAGILCNNLGSFSSTLFENRFWLPFASAWNVIGLAGLVYLASTMPKRFNGLQRWEKKFAVIMLAAITALFALIFSYGPDAFRYPVTARYYLPVAVFLSLSGAWFLSQFAFITKTRFFALALGAFLIYHPIAMAGSFSRTYVFNQEYHFIDSFWKRLPDRDTCLLVTQMPQQYAAGWSRAAVSPYMILENKKEFLEKERYTYSRVFIAEAIDPATGKRLGAKLGKEFRLRFIDQMKVGADRIIRISEVLPKYPNASPTGGKNL